MYEKVSPLTGRKGEKLFSELLTVSDEPLDDTRPGARAFDDEGTVCRSMKLVEAGRLSGYYCDRYYAWKLGGEPTGHGYRSGIEAKAVPTLEHLVIKPGEASLERLIGMMDSGIIVSSVLGAHSGNILNGDYSIGLSPGFCVEKGKVIGHVKDAMVAGNIYDTLKNVVAVGDRLFPAHLGWFPALLLDGVNFAARAKAPALFSVGLMDSTCPPSTVYAAYNYYSGPKQIKNWSYNNHEGGGPYQAVEKVKFLGKLFEDA